MAHPDDWEHRFRVQRAALELRVAVQRIVIVAERSPLEAVHVAYDATIALADHVLEGLQAWEEWRRELQRENGSA